MSMNSEAGPRSLHWWIEAAGVGIVEFDYEGRATYVNRFWRKLTGSDQPVPIDGYELLELVHPDDRQGGTEQWLEVVETGEPRESLVRFVQPDGQITAVWARMEAVLGGSGQVEAFVGTLFDITRTLEAEARDRVEHYEELHRQAPVGQLVATLEGEIVEVNQAFADILDTTPHALVGKFPWDIYHPDDLEQVMSQYVRLKEGEAAFVDEEVRLVRADRSVAWIVGAASLVQDPQGQPRLMQTVVLDVTAQHRTREALSESEERYRVLVDTLNEGILILDDQGQVEAVNQGALTILGIEATEFPDDAPIPEDWQLVDRDGTPLGVDESPPGITYATGEPVDDALMGLERPGRERMWVRLNARPLQRGPDARGLVISFEDITAAKVAQDRLEESERRYRTLVETAPVGQVVTDLAGRFVQANKAYADIMGYEPDEMIGMMPWDTIHPDHLEEMGAQVQLLLDGEMDSFEIERRAIRSDGAVVWCRGPVSLVRDERGEALQIHAMVQDVTRQKAAEDALQESELRYRSTVDALHEGVLVSRNDGTFIMNARAQELTGLKQEEVVDSHAFEQLDPRDENGAFIPFEDRAPVVASRTGRTVTDQLLRITTPSGESRWLLSSATPLFDEQGMPEGAVNTFSDVTDKVERERNLAHAATHDPLTDLPNRTLLIELIDHALARTTRDGGLVALLFLDLDHFKTVNDNHGHETGDRLLVEVAQRIGAVLRPSDTVARVGGDEFVVLCDHVQDEHEAVAITQRVAGALESGPVELHGVSIPIAASIGISLSRNADSHAEGLLRDADAAMYRAKDRGRARHELFDETMRRRSARRLELAEELSLGIEREEIVVHYQPLVDLNTGRVRGVEALARWDHPTRGLLAPAEFITLAEETGLIVGLGLSVLSQTCEQAHLWGNELGDTAPRVHVNLSARQIIRSNLARLVQGVVSQSLIDPRRLCLEITESVLMEDAATAEQALAELKAIGVDLAIDDFGTGYSSLSYLRRFPVDVVKIDRSFIDGLGPDPDDSAIVSAIVHLARTLELECIAEGVETDTQLAELRALGCRAAQGFLFTRPRPPEDITRYLMDGFDLTPV